MDESEENERKPKPNTKQKSGIAAVIKRPRTRPRVQYELYVQSLTLPAVSWMTGQCANRPSFAD